MGIYIIEEYISFDKDFPLIYYLLKRSNAKVQKSFDYIE